ncbi:hypothetical protein P7M36_22670 [Vibrio parahaemolyticus]|nr:hypothetical protein [Vibrio parahaemolyticus]HCE1980938.1 hypothetical protein [Vibrio parahaemolyticus]HCG6659681.1 hypothetical protein [Vibrio parahaemolyticus]
MESKKLFFGFHGLQLPETGFGLGNGVVVRETCPFYGCFGSTRRAY